MACVKEMKLKLGECGKHSMKKDGLVIELVLMNIRTLYVVLCSSFYTISRSHKEDVKDYIFDAFCYLFIKDQWKLLDKGKLGGKQ